MPWRGPQQPGEYPTTGYAVADWIEDTLLITDGPSIGSPFRLYDEQLAHLLQLFRLDPAAPGDAGNDAFRHGGSMLVRGQKWGKDPFLAALDLAFAFGPVDFAGWDADGEPVGQPAPSPWIFVAALNDLQANNTWLPLKAMAESSDLVDLSGVEITQDSIRLPCGNPIERLTTTAFGRLGGRFTGGSLTENGLMSGTGEGGNTGKRSPLSFARTLLRSVDGMGGKWAAATNTWDPTEYSHAQLVYEGKDPHTFVDARLSRSHVDLDDDGRLDDELRFLYGDTLKERGGHQSLQRLKRSVRNPATGETEARRFFLSEILAGESPLCTPERWAALARDDDPLAPGEAITLGFDGSRSRDATVLTACRIRDGRLFHLRTWLPQCMCGPDAGHAPERCRDMRVDRLAVDRAVTDAFTAYDVWFLFADPYKWQDYLDLWWARWSKKVIEQPTNAETRMDQMLERFTTARDSGDITHDGDPVLTEHVANAVIIKGRKKPSRIRFDSDGRPVEHYLKVGKKREGLLIDAAISGPILAFDARGRAVEDGALNVEPPRPPVAPIAVDADGSSSDPALAAGRGPLDDLTRVEDLQF